MGKCGVSAYLLNMDCFGEHQCFLKWRFNIHVSSFSLLIVIYFGHNGDFLLSWIFYCSYFIALRRQVFEHWYTGRGRCPGYQVSDIKALHLYSDLPLDVVLYSEGSRAGSRQLPGPSEVWGTAGLVWPNMENRPVNSVHIVCKSNHCWSSPEYI